MTQQVEKISIVQTSKVFAVMAFIFSAFYAIPIGIFLLFSGAAQEAIAAFVLPFLAAFMAFIAYVVLFFIYNLIAGAFGGIEFKLKQVE